SPAGKGENARRKLERPQKGPEGCDRITIRPTSSAALGVEWAAFQARHDARTLAAGRARLPRGGDAAGGGAGSPRSWRGVIGRAAVVIEPPARRSGSATPRGTEDASAPFWSPDRSLGGFRRGWQTEEDRRFGRTQRVRPKNGGVRHAVPRTRRESSSVHGGWH